MLYNSSNEQELKFGDRTPLIQIRLYEITDAVSIYDTLLRIVGDIKGTSP